MAYTKLGWVNDRAPALNQTNLNHMDQGIYEAHRKLSEYEDIFTGDVAESVQNWLDEHPEATTTVEDGSITVAKLHQTLKTFVTPQMFGAAADGVTDDTQAFQTALFVGNVFLPNGEYLITSNLIVYHGIICGDDAKIKLSNCNIIYTNRCDIQGVDFELSGDALSFIRFDTSYYAEHLRISNCNFTHPDDPTVNSKYVGIRVRANNVVVENCNFFGIHRCLVAEPHSSLPNNSVNFNHLYAENTKTIVDIEGTSSNIVKNVHISDITLVNTETQKDSIPTEVGSDAVLFMYCQDVVVTNVIAINPRERAVYANLFKDGVISNIYCYGSQVIKVCGTSDYYTERVSVNNVHGVNNKKGYLYMSYYVKDVFVSDIHQINHSDLDSFQLIRLENSCENVVIDGFSIEGGTRGGITFEKTASGATISGIVIRNGIIKNCGRYVPNTAIWLIDNTNDNATWVQNLTIENVSLDPQATIIGNTNGFINLENVSGVLLKGNVIRGVNATSLKTCGLIVGNNVSNLKLIGTFPNSNRDCWFDIPFTSDSDVCLFSHGSTATLDAKAYYDGNSHILGEGFVHLTTSYATVLDAGSTDYQYVEVSGKGSYGRWSVTSGTPTAIGTPTGVAMTTFGRIKADVEGVYHYKFLR